MAKVAVLGLGAMGSRMARNLIKAGHEVTVWNRTPAATSPLVALGAAQSATPKDAVVGAAFVMAMVRDDDASRQVWLAPETGALVGMAAGSIAIESSTLTPGWVRELGENLARRKVSLLEAPVSGTTPQAEAGQLIYLIGGEAEVLAKSEPVLKAMGSAIHHVGAVGSGALAKLVTNTLLGTQVTVLAELVGMLERSGADVARTMEAVAATPVWSVIAGRAVGSMLSGNFAPQFPIELIEKDFGYTVHEAGCADAAPTISAAHSVFRKGVDAGFAKDNMTGVVRLFTDPTLK